MRKKIAAVLCAAAAFLTMSGCKKVPPGTLTGISVALQKNKKQIENRTEK